MVPFDRPHTTSYSFATSHLGLYLALFLRFYHLVPKFYGGHVTLNTSLLGVICHTCSSTLLCQSAQDI